MDINKYAQEAAKFAIYDNKPITDPFINHMERPIMNFNEYQNKAKQFAIYKDKIVYPTLGLASEAGEVCGKIKKVMRDTQGIHTLKSKYDRVLEIKAELGDVLWYIANIAEDLEIPLQDIAEENIAKLQDRMDRNKIQGSGDKR